ncbi:hypothetical protein [Butyrivibrio sp. INlla16]|uniref:hypothetical protein n=1 Tax=Butyrivibrio sp. INlla16 TaxID=1520807 RepID=UPI00088C7E26|nr:hypothetical protein [Butyrivibrio sp. INlla16]SDB53059.1 hypothetical protein SAMN02910263_02678 [Butyrivibrio sp. INlla16]
MRKKFGTVAFVLTLSIISTACTVIFPGKEEEKTEYVREIKTNDEQVEIGHIDFIVLAENDKHVYEASFPENCHFFILFS